MRLLPWNFTIQQARSGDHPLANHAQNHLPCTGIAQPHATTPTHHLGDITGFPGSAHQMRQGRMQTQMQIPPPQIEADPALGIGLTESQTAAENLRKGIQEGACDGGEFKPANPDKHQQYWVQEVNGAVALMPRHVIDRMGASVRWVMRNGDFVAVRLDAGPCPH
ncbi:hypothetical protein QBC44DRAFT_319184 [Cladorrhinum sp. PSN332]|nr:hypothetical protein QBC44DRAFT_319184 [Cladorrhinum sp. PSN332]